MSIIEREIREMQRLAKVDKSYSLSDALAELEQLGRELAERGMGSFEDVRETVKFARKTYLKQNSL